MGRDIRRSSGKWSRFPILTCFTGRKYWWNKRNRWWWSHRRQYRPRHSDRWRRGRYTLWRIISHWLSNTDRRWRHYPGRQWPNTLWCWSRWWNCRNPRQWHASQGLGSGRGHCWSISDPSQGFIFPLARWQRYSQTQIQPARRRSDRFS